MPTHKADSWQQWWRINGPVLIGGIAVVALFCIFINARLLRPGFVFTGMENVQILEAQVWWEGRLDIGERQWDTALIDGKVYSYFPSMFTLISACLVPIFGGVPHKLVVMLALSVPVLAYLLFYRLARSVLWAVILSCGLVVGTSALPVLTIAIATGKPYHVNHTLALIGQLLISIDLLGKRRIWPACAGLLLASLSRQMTFLYLAPIVAITVSETTEDRRKKLTWVILTFMSIAGIYGTLNALKFGHLLHTGYMQIHEERNDALARDATEYGLFSPTYFFRNLYYTNLGFPELYRIQVEGMTQWHLRPNMMGTGIWWTTPLLLWLFFDRRSLWEDRRRLWLAISASAVYLLLQLWYTTGWMQRGYNRFSLDYLPVLFALVVPWCLKGRRKWLTLVMILWSVLYFRFVIQWSSVRVW